MKKNLSDDLSCELGGSAALKAHLLEHLLDAVGERGWREEVLEETACALGHPAQLAWALFPDGCADAIACWSRDIDQQMVGQLAALPFDTFKIRERIFWAVRTRLDLLERHKKAVAQTTRFFLNPRHACDGTRLGYETVDAMWVAAGDTSTDYNYYTKRLLLSGVYGATLLYWLNDKSLSHGHTWAFLERRIGTVLKIEDLKRALQHRWKSFKSA